MKKILFTIALISGLVSCYNDESTFATYEYPEIIISASNEEEAINVAFGSYLTMSADATQEGVDESMLEYLWEIDMQPGSSKDRAFLSDE